MSVLLGSWTQDPDEHLDYAINWSKYLQGDDVVASTWVADSGLTVDKSEFDKNRTVVRISGGVAGTSYNVRNTVTSALGRTVKRSIKISVHAL